MIKGFRHCCIVVNNLERSLKFYRDAIGLKVSKILTVEGKSAERLFNIKGIKLTYVKLRSPNQPKKSPPIFELHFWHNPKRISEPGYNHISFTVDDIDYEYKRLKKLGVKFISVPVKVSYSDSKICFGLDPDKNLIEFVENLSRQSP
jgi:catechol 2,3-dioxygenase-like lactoylglutathione lyase family enzyme